MTKPPLGKLELVSLRDYWLREDSEFTPWLSEPEELQLLGDSTGTHAEPQGRVVGVGLRRAGTRAKRWSASGARELASGRTDVRSPSDERRAAAWASF